MYGFRNIQETVPLICKLEIEVATTSTRSHNGVEIVPEVPQKLALHADLGDKTTSQLAAALYHSTCNKANRLLEFFRLAPSPSTRTIDGSMRCLTVRVLPWRCFRLYPQRAARARSRLPSLNMFVLILTPQSDFIGTH